MVTTTSNNNILGRVVFLSLLSLMHDNHNCNISGGVTAFCIAPPLPISTTTTAFTTTTKKIQSKCLLLRSTPSENTMIEQSPQFGNGHGTNACFLPLQQLEQDTYMPRIIYIVNGIYPSNEMSMESIQQTPQSEYAPALGQWTYTFQTSTNDNNNSRDVVQASIALAGSNIVASCEDPIIVIAEHTALNLLLPTEITEPVDVLVLIDRSKTYFSERTFLLFAVVHTDDPPQQEQPQPQVRIAAFHTRDEIPSHAIVLGHVKQVTIPWLPSMAPTKTGFLEADEYY